MTPASATPVRRQAEQVDVSSAGSASAQQGSQDAQNDHWPHALGQLERLTLLRNGWDGETAVAIDRAAISNAERFMESLRTGALPAPHVVPMPNGGVNLEWARGGRHLEVEFDAEGDVIFVCDDPNLSAGIDGQLPADAHLFNAALQRTFGS